MRQSGADETIATTASTRSRPRWFTTVQPFVRSNAGGQLEELHHAKLFGTNLTACGLNAMSWPRLWERPFSSAPGSECSICLELVRKATESVVDARNLLRADGSPSG